jgi:hypothetical protein
MSPVSVVFRRSIKSRSPFTQHIFGFEWCISEVAYTRNMMNLPMYRTTVPPLDKRRLSSYRENTSPWVDHK